MINFDEITSEILQNLEDRLQKIIKDEGFQEKADGLNIGINIIKKIIDKYTNN